MNRAPVTERQSQVLELRDQGNTWAEIARLLGISRERVRQLRVVLIDKGELKQEE